MRKEKRNTKQLEEIIRVYKKKGRIFQYSLKYICFENFFVNKQFDNKNFCVVETSGKSEGVLGLFKRKKDAVAFGTALGLKEITAPQI